MLKREAWIQWPSRQCWLAFVHYGALLTILWIVIYGGANWVTSLHPYRFRLHFDAELYMPFHPAAAVVYLSLFPMLWLSPFVLQTEERLKSFAKALAWLFLLCGLGFLLLPSEEVRVHETATNFFGQVFTFADWINLRYNYLPSLHVGMAVLCAYVYVDSAPPKLALLLWGWAAVISLSTLITHQHYVVDVLAGGALGYLIAKTSYRRR